MRGYLKTLGWVFKLHPKTTTVGRHKDSDLCLENGGVEEHHALIELDEQERCFVLRDMNSAHGTYVNKCHIHNASVRLSPGDELHFGYGGPTFQLCVDSTPQAPPQLSCPAVPKRVAWQTPVQLVEEPRSLCSSVSSQFPHLAPSPGSRSRGGPAAGPRPPSRGRPTNAGATKAKLGLSANHVVPPRRAGSQIRISGGGDAPGNGEVLPSSHILHHLLQEKDEQVLRLGDEVSRLVPFESESHRKDGVIAKLRDQVSVLRHQVTQAAPEVNLRLRGLERDISEKNEQIEELKEQMVALQRGSGEVLKHSLGERDLKIASLRAQLEKLKRDSGTSAGLVTSLQKDLSTQEKKALALAAEVERLRQDMRRKDAQLANVTSKVKESAKVQEELHAREKDVEVLQKRLEELQQTRIQMQTALVQRGTERDALKVTLDMERREKVSLGAELEETRLKEQEALTQLKQSQEQVERFSRQIIQAVSGTPGGSPFQGTLSDQQMVQQMTEIIREGEALRNKVKELQEELKEAAAERDRRIAEEHTVKNLLEDGNARLREALSAPALHREVTALKALRVPPALAWVHATVLGMLDCQLTQVEEATRALLHAGIDMSDSEEYPAGISGGIRALSQRQQQCEDYLRALQAELRASQETQIQSKENHTKELQERLESLKEEHAKELQERLESLKEDNAKELQERLESLKEDNAKELQERLDSLKEDHAKELQEHLESLKEDYAKELQENLDSLKEDHAKELQERLESLKEEHAKELQERLKSLKEEHAKELQERLESLKEDNAKELQERLESLKEDNAKELQERLDSLKEDHAKELQEHLESLKEDYAKELQERLDSLKEDHAKELQEHLESLKEDYAKELQENLESLKEDHTKELQEHMASLKEELEKQEQQKLEAQKEEEVRLKLQLEEMRGELESSKTAEATLREQVRTQEVEQEARLAEAEQKGAESERKCWTSLEEEYREQVRQHAHTIVAMEEKIVELRQRLGDNDKERDSLREQLRDVEEKFNHGEAEKATKVEALEEKITALRDALAEARKEADAQGEVIAALSRDLSAANARMSDTAEVSERQKAELERHRALVVQQKVHLGTLTQKLGQMSRLVDQKGAELQRAQEELRLCQEALQDRVSRERQEGLDPKHTCAECQATAQTVTSKLCDHQMAMMRLWSNGLGTQRADGQGSATTCQHGRLTPAAVCGETLERTARLDLSDTLDLSERTYLELVHALSEVLELSEERLSGSAPLKYLPREERERVATCRLRDLEVLRGQAQRREEQLREYQRDQRTWRESQVAEQRLQGRVDSLREELQAERQESALLREALRRTRERLEQEVALNRTIKERKAVVLDRGPSKSGRVVTHSCVQPGLRDKVASRKPRLQEKLRRKEYETEVLKEQLRRREQELRDATSALEAMTPAESS